MRHASPIIRTKAYCALACKQFYVCLQAIAQVDLFVYHKKLFQLPWMHRESNTQGLWQAGNQQQVK